MPGRFELIQINKCKCFLDGAHNELSIGQVVQWFARSLEDLALSNPGHKLRPYAIIFSHLSEDRDGIQLLKSLAKALEANHLEPEHMIFTTYQERQDRRTRLGKQEKSVPLTFCANTFRQNLEGASQHPH